MRFTFPAFCLILLSATALMAQAPVLPPGDRKPFLRVETNGPNSIVTSLAFRPDGKTLYEAGFDKIVHVWKLDEQNHRFDLDPAATYRVPIGPGLEGGAINAIAVSPDGEWLAVAGLGLVRDGAGFRQSGVIMATSMFTQEMWQDRGMIHVFNTQKRDVRLLRGHAGPVLSLAFAAAQADKPPLLVSSAREWDSGKSRYVGAVRLWDVSKVKDNEVDRENLPDPENRRPGLTAWHTGNELKQVQVAIAWGDGKFRIWDVGQANERLRSESDGRLFNDTIARLPEFAAANRTQLITSSFREDLNGQIQMWQVPVQGLIRADGMRQAIWYSDNATGTYFAPRALALISAQANGTVDHAAVAVRVKTSKGEEYRLRIISLEANNFGKAVAREITLWQGGGIQPVLAAVPHGRYLAVAGNSERSIHMYAIADLLKGQAKPQIIHGEGTVFSQVRFAKKGKDVGLLLSTTPAGAGDLIFDVAARNLTTNLQGWKADVPNLKTEGWEVTVVQPMKDAGGKVTAPALLIRPAAGKERRIELEPGQNVTDFALMPPRKPLFDVPIAAVALVDEHHEPQLFLYNAATGEKLRQLVSHTAYIRSLAFSADGRLLASAADDQTVCIWSMTDLGVDFRNPLFTFLCTADGKAEARDWIGWSPYGNYDSSARKAERLIGWHVNTGDAANPAAFAGADKYHDDFYGKDLLKYLVARGDLAEALKEMQKSERLNPPGLTLWVNELGLEPPKEGNGHWLVHQPKATLKLAVSDFPVDRIATLEWKADNIMPGKLPALAGKFDAGTDRERSASLAELKRGIYRVRAFLQTQETEPQKCWRELTLRYQPPPAAMVLPGVLKQQMVVEKEDFPFRATIRPGLPGESVAVAVTHKYKGETVARATFVVDAAEGQEIARQFALRPGENEIEVWAVNSNFLPGYQEDETMRSTICVTYKKNALAAQIDLQRIVPMTPGAGDSRSWPVERGRPVVVDVPKVRIEGKIKAEDNIVKASGSKGDWKLDKPAAELEIREEVTLKPGEQIFRYQARTTSGEEAETGLTLKYQPRLPVVVLTARVPKRDLYEGQDSADVEIVGSIIPSSDPHPFTAVVLVNGKERPDFPITIQKDMRRLSGTVKLWVGDNRIQVRLRNEWKAVATQGDIQMRFLRPPRDIKLTGPDASKQALVDLTASVVSTSPLQMESLRLEVNGREDRIVKVEHKAPGREQGTGADPSYFLALKEVPLDPGKNNIRLWISNADGQCLEPGSKLITYDKPTLPRPEITFLEPQDSRSTLSPALSVHFQIKSSSALHRVDLVREQQQRSPVRRTFDIQPDSQGNYVGEADLQLAPGVNLLRIEAVNEGGEQSSAIVVSYIPVSQGH